MSFKEFLQKYWIILAIAIILVLYYIVLPSILSTSVPIGYVASGSMEPTYKVGDLIIIKGAKPEDIKIGDVIVFKYNEKLIMHRVISKKYDGEFYWFLTRGDNPFNVPVDPWLWIREDKIIGVVIARIPYLGYLFMILSEPLIRLLLFLVLVNVIMLDIFYTRTRGAQEEEKEELKYGFKRMGRKIIKVFFIIMCFVIFCVVILRVYFTYYAGMSINISPAGNVLHIRGVGYIYPLKIEIKSPAWPGKYIYEVTVKFLYVNSSQYVWRSVFPYGGCYEIGATIISTEFRKNVACIVNVIVIDPITNERKTMELEENITFPLFLIV